MSVFKCLLNYLKKHYFITIFTLLIIVFVTIISLLPPQLLRIIVDDILVKKAISKLLTFAILYTLSFVLIGVIDFLKEVLLVVISQGFSKDLRYQMILKIHRVKYINFKKYDSGTLEAFFSNDVEEINSLITSGVVSMAIDALKIIGIIVSIFIYSYVFGLISIALIPLILIFSLWIKKKMFKAQRRNRELEASVNNLLLENVSNIKTIKSFRIYDNTISKYDSVLENHFEANTKSNTYDAFFSPVMQMVKTIVIVLIIILSAAKNNIFGMSIGMVASSIDLITNLFKPVESLGTELQTIQKSIAAISHINELFMLEEDDIKNMSLNNTNELTLEFKDVSFSYDEENFVFKDFNLVLHNNDRLSLKGVSGSGKSTLFKLAYGLIKPSKGRVMINGVDTYLLKDEEKRKIFGIVYQDYYFSGGSIKDEICLQNKNVSDEEVYIVLHLVGLDRVKDINKELKTNDYSTGELSLFNIARAIIFKSNILFLDEMNAKIDFLSAKKIIDVINNVSKNKMVLSINHFGDLIENSKILVLEK